MRPMIYLLYSQTKDIECKCKDSEKSYAGNVPGKIQFEFHAPVTLCPYY